MHITIAFTVIVLPHAGIGGVQLGHSHGSLLKTLTPHPLGSSGPLKSMNGKPSPVGTSNPQH